MCPASSSVVDRAADSSTATADSPSASNPTRTSEFPDEPVAAAPDKDSNDSRDYEDTDLHLGGHGVNTEVVSSSQVEEEALDEFGLPFRAHPRTVRSASMKSEKHEDFYEAQESPADEAPECKPDGRQNDEQSVTEHSTSSRGEAVNSNQSAGEEKEFAGSGEHANIVMVDTVLSVASKLGGLSRQQEIHPQTNEDSDPPNNDGTREPQESGLEQSSEQIRSGEREIQVEDQPRPTHLRQKSRASKWSHQRLTEDPQSDGEEDKEEDGGWKEMPALGELDVYDDFGHLVARGSKEEDDGASHSKPGAAGKGYTRVQLDEDAQSATSMDEETSYLFRDGNAPSAEGEGEELRDATSQLQATKNILTESQRIAYVGVTRLAMHQIMLELENMPSTKSTQKIIQKAAESMKKWSQSTMVRLYSHMDIDSAEQVMIEQLAEHGVQPADLVRPLMQNARVRNPLAGNVDSGRENVPFFSSPANQSSRSGLSTAPERASPPPYEALADDDAPRAGSPQPPSSQTIDIDIRWTVLCDLFLVLVSDAAYDARSRALLERIGEAMEISWQQICRFEKRVTDALEMQEEADKETWDESETLEKRRNLALKQRYMIMGLATVSGGLVIGLSAGLLAPVIGAGLAATFTTIGVSGTGAFLGGAGGTALIASGATLTGSAIGLKASDKRTGAVQTFEYRPLHNNKRVNLIITVSGWMTGKVDDVRLPFSTIDPIMGDLFSVLWEPKMLQSMGDTINILATEALTTGLQQVLGNTILVALMASVQLPIVLTKLSYLIANPWNVSLARANAAGLILADSIKNNSLGKRPITLLGFSLGSRVILSCLKELADKGAFGLVQNVFVFGSPVVASRDDYLKARSVVCGRFVNGYSSNDWILGYLFRATSGGIMRVAGLAPIEGIPGLENFDATKLVNGHMDYRRAMPRLLREVGWEVLSDEFAEIEDPDPENHAQRQRELIREIDEARREAEHKPEKKRFGLFKRGKLAKKKAWETYEVDRNFSSSPSSSENETAGSVLFDIDAIRAELASEMIEVKQLESTLPPMKLELKPGGQSFAVPSISSPGDSQVRLKQSKSTEHIATTPHARGETLSPLRVASRNIHSLSKEDLQLTLDSSFHSPPQQSYSSPLQNAYESGPNYHDPRPGLRSAATTPAVVSTGSRSFSTLALAERNAWEDKDVANGEEGEVHMTFE